MSEKTNDIGPQPGPDFVRPDTPAHRWLEEANAAASSDWIDGFNKCAELRIAPSKGGPTPYFNRSMVEVHAYQYHARHPFDCLERAAEIASEADAEIERLRARVAELEQDRMHAGVDICEVAAAVEIVRAQEVVKAVEALADGYHDGPFRHGFETACEEIAHRLRPCEHCDAALSKDAAP